MASHTPRLVLVTGPSGAGRSSAINVLEDLGFESIDNIPLRLVERLFSGPRMERPLALGLDTRNRDFSPAALIKLLDQLEAHDPELLYLDCSRDVLQRRYSETRRRHPMAPEESAIEGIDRELELLTVVKERADILLNTTDLTVHTLRDALQSMFIKEGQKLLALTVQSFSYKRGLPSGLDIVYDCRFLSNPYWKKELRALDGRSAEVGAYIRRDERFAPFFDKLSDMVRFLLPAYRDEGKAHLSIGFGCTGGQHRSVFVTEKLCEALAQEGWRVSIRHRELDRREGRDVTGSAGSGEAKA